MKFNKAKWKVLHLGPSNPRHTYRLGREVTESSPAEEHLGVMVDEKLTMSWHWALIAQKADRIPGCIQRNVGSRAREGTVPLCPAPVRPHLQSEHSSGAPNVRRTWNCWIKSRGHNVGKRTGAPSLQREAEKVGAVQPGERRLRGDLIGTFQYLMGLQGSRRGTLCLEL